MAGFRVEGKVEGLQPLLRRVRALEDRARVKVLRKAVAAAGKVVLKAARTLAPTESKLLKRSLGQRVKVYKAAATAVAVVGPRKGFREPVLRRKGKWAPAQPKPSGLGNPVAYAHLVERGVRPHAVARGARLARRGRAAVRQGGPLQHPGAAARGFLEPAAAGQAAAVREAMANAIAKEIG